MTQSLRQDAILRAVRRNGSVRVNDIAAELGVSTMTVRRDITALADRGAIARVHGGATLPRARPATALSPVSAPLSTQSYQSHTKRQQLSVGMLVPAASHYYRQVIQGAQAAAEPLGIRLTLGVSCYDPAEDRAQVERLLESRPDGLLLTPSRPALSPEPSALTWISELPVPTVIVERHYTPGTGPYLLDSVSSDHELGAVRALDHLAGLGHRHIALLTCPTPTSPWIRSGFDRAVGMLGLVADTPRVADHLYDSAEELDAFLDAVTASGTTAVLAHPDEQAARLLQQALTRGMAVPDDLAIVAYDDELAALADIPLTAVAPARRAVGRAAVAALAQRLREGRDHVPQRTLLVPRLNIRSSTAP
ncbi:LacI family DNA-binding transcriptional regulator [Streptomyces sp. FIT100]|uniref:LacI family DNA-binding transcriptional regulator n=1 Tax=Streptomyces sp. FIT100 TaxID=2837956 RepID=UPI0021C67EE4|nr:LacI family DNA-binding transcriptional regulator [Streptomyces sp. FIT100]UUN30101.1 LacI family transcriptional regulator [Streptomyces sp. FIT100]